MGAHIDIIDPKAGAANISNSSTIFLKGNPCIEGGRGNTQVSSCEKKRAQEEGQTGGGEIGINSFSDKFDC